MNTRSGLVDCGSTDWGVLSFTFQSSLTQNWIKYLQEKCWAGPAGLVSYGTQRAARWAAGSLRRTVPLPRCRGRTGRWFGRWRTFRMLRCCESPSWSSLWGSAGKATESLKIIESNTAFYLQYKFAALQESQAAGAKLGRYLVQLTDSLLTADVGFVISEHLKPGGQRHDFTDKQSVLNSSAFWNQKEPT